MKGKFSEEPKIMNLYVLICSIIDRYGPTSILSICEKVNNHAQFMKERDKPVGQAQIKSVISRKKDLFAVHDDIVSLLPERVFVSMTAEIGACRGPWFKVKVDFVRKTFMVFGMNLDPANELDYQPIVAGSTDEFKHEIFKMKLWNWEPSYERQEIVLDGTCWSITLKTIGQTYKSEGLNVFPKEWAKFSKALSKLIGKKLC